MNPVGASTSSETIGQMTAQSSVHPTDKSPHPGWMNFWGWPAVLFGIAGFAASGHLHKSERDPFIGLIAGPFNPMLFFGVPVGLYWLSKSGELDRDLDTERGKFAIAAAIELGISTLLSLVGVFR